MKRIPVASSMIRSAGYDARTHSLELEFTSGHVYRYEDVPEPEYRDLMAAESKGQYVQDNIIDLYPYRKVK